MGNVINDCAKYIVDTLDQDSLDRYNELVDLKYDDKKELDSKKREKALKDFFAVCIKRDFKCLIFVLGYRDLGKFHEEEIDRIAEVRTLEGPTRRLWLWSRGFFKTSIINISHIIFLILNNPNIRILLVSYTLDIAKKMLDECKGHFVSNEAFRYFFPEFCPVSNKEGKIEFGTTELFTIDNRVKKLKEPTLMCAGLGTNLTGLHFDYMKIDDLTNEKAVTNDTQILAGKDFYASLRQLYDNPTIPREDVIGTIYHFNDIHCDLQKNLEFEKSFIPVHINDIYTFPERINEAGFQSIVNDPSVGPYKAQTQYLLNPIDPSKAKFKEEWLQYYYERPKSLAEYVCVDPASTLKKKSDYTVIQRWGIDWQGKHYLLEGIRDKLNASDRIDKLFQVVKNSQNLKFVKYEVLGGRHGDLEMIKRKQMETKTYFLIKETKSTTAAKADRIEQRLVGPWNAGVIYLPQSLPFNSKYDNKVQDFVSQYKLEFLQFPFSEHDDILDCHSQMFEEQLSVAEKPRNAVKVRETPQWTADDWEKRYDLEKQLHSKNPWLDKVQIRQKLVNNRMVSIIRRAM